MLKHELQRFIRASVTLTLGQVFANSRPAIGQQLLNKRPTDDRKTAENHQLF